ncbi:Crp/Fnr family transcriptional regulator [Paenibacillus qinlingensis]|uniref:CRP/FNR family transcriptional regulator n=1 Tax=Paenibacillus qinlingensis TaxID=1837343 RepID=A0ABU1NT43_9BACL|nr:Crp/Fnr family transcriptional regulator [Paenibacillus qinlingensis]MDR6550221.1 CRP/FNR family transcriptional regulator [Paenibacillus qinlingensis]
MSSNLSEYLPLINSKFPSLADISDQDWDQVGIRVVEMEPNYTIKEGQLLEYAFLLLDGTVRMYKLSASGREYTLYRIHSGECCPLMSSSILCEGEYEASACVETNGLVLLIPVDMFRHWTDHYQMFRQFIFKSFANRILIMSNLLDSLNFKSIRGRVSEFLVQLAQQGDESEPLHITHDSMSVELGTAREVISRTLKALEKEGIIQLSRGKITIRDLNALEQYVES